RFHAHQQLWESIQLRCNIVDVFSSFNEVRTEGDCGSHVSWITLKELNCLRGFGGRHTAIPKSFQHLCLIALSFDPRLGAAETRLKSEIELASGEGVAGGVQRRAVVGDIDD